MAASVDADDRVVCLGKKTREQIAEELRAASCIVILSIDAPDGDRDGTPNVLGEAIAAGVPVVASRIAGITDYGVGGEAGLLHEAGDADGLRACLRAIVQSTALGGSFAAEAPARFQHANDVRTVARRCGEWCRAARVT